MAHDEVFLAFVLQLGAGIFAIKNLVASLEHDLFVLGAAAYGNDCALEGFLFSCVGDDDAADGLLFCCSGFDENSVC